MEEKGGRQKRDFKMLNDVPLQFRSSSPTLRDGDLNSDTVREKNGIAKAEVLYLNNIV